MQKNFFHKFHALGNDYIVIDPNKNTIQMNEKEIQRICHRNFGIGSDGILYGPIYKNKKITLKIFNPDGSEAEKSGNGIRIFSKYLFDEKYITDKIFTLSTKGGDVLVQILDDSAELIKVDMGRAEFKSLLIPTNFNSEEAINQDIKLSNNEVYKVSCVSVGNPHCVILRDQISSDLAIKLGHLIETHAMFPNKINVQFMKILNRKNIQIEIWERGAAYTLASGSSSCAAASVAYKLGLIDNTVTVCMPGGKLQIFIDKDYNIQMTGTVTPVSQGEISNEIFNFQLQ